MPQEIAATCSRKGSTEMMERPRIQAKQSWRATQAPVIAAVRVPPSACSTSQSTVICRSPMAGRLVTARKLRQHRVFGGDPALARAAKPGRAAFFEGGGAQHLGLAECDEAGTLGIAGDGALEGDAAQGVVGALRRPHGALPHGCRWCEIALLGVRIVSSKRDAP